MGDAADRSSSAARRGFDVPSGNDAVKAWLREKRLTAPLAQAEAAETPALSCLRSRRTTESLRDNLSLSPYHCGRRSLPRKNAWAGWLNRTVSLRARKELWSPRGCA